jgi:hypothetical protein
MTNNDFRFRDSSCEEIRYLANETEKSLKFRFSNFEVRQSLANSFNQINIFCAQINSLI